MRRIGADIYMTLQEEEEGVVVVVHRTSRHHPHAMPAVPQASQLLCRIDAATEASFLIGTRGRNVRLIKDHCHAEVCVSENEVRFMPRASPSLYNDDALMRMWRMVLSCLGGGVLRWCVTPAASRRFFPHPPLKALAATCGCDLEQLRARTGHTCLLLLPRMAEVPPDAATLARLKSSVRDARAVLMPALRSITAATTVTKAQ